jgi:hypothetical protein
VVGFSHIIAATTQGTTKAAPNYRTPNASLSQPSFAFLRAILKPEPRIVYSLVRRQKFSEIKHRPFQQIGPEVKRQKFLPRIASPQCF